MKKTLLFSAFGLMMSLTCTAQLTRYIIKFKDKGTNPYSLSSPLQYLAQRAIDRRSRYNIGIDSTDLPVTPRYIDSIRLAGNVIILTTSKWLNQVAIQTTDATALDKIAAFPFVSGTSAIGSRSSLEPVNKKLFFGNTDVDVPLSNTTRTATDFYDYGSSQGQVKIHNGDFLHNRGFRGEGMHMAVLDAGFFNYLSLPTFDSIRNNNQVLATWDFVANDANVNEDNSHGMLCLSTIAANMPGSFVGTAPNTSFYLFRTEDVGSEYPIEEQNWAAGLERADSLGVDVTSTSLGYFDFDGIEFDYPYSAMDGNTTISARAADIGAKKGMLMISAAGNEGNNNLYPYLITPSDADSILSVGAVNVASQVAGFSSYGPSSDGQVKPAVAAVGLNAVVANSSTGMPAFGSGTSFACPNMAGISTCLWQAFPEVNNMDIIQSLQTSATRANNPDNRIGYGIPDAKKAFVILVKKLFTQQASIVNCRTDLQFSVKTDPGMNIEVQRKLPGETGFSTLSILQDPGNFEKHDFTYADELNTVPLGNILYRLKMNIDADTSFYLDSLTLNYVQACILPTQNSILITPNPVSENLNITIGRINVSRIGIVIQNAAGQKVYTNQFEQQSGVQLRTISLANLSKGVYFVSVYSDNKKEVTKKIIKK